MLRMVRKYRYMYRNFAIAHKCNLFLGFFGVTECVLTLKNLSLGTKNSPLSYPMARAKSLNLATSRWDTNTHQVVLMLSLSEKREEFVGCNFLYNSCEKHPSTFFYGSSLIEVVADTRQ